MLVGLPQLDVAAALAECLVLSVVPILPVDDATERIEPQPIALEDAPVAREASGVCRSGDQLCPDLAEAADEILDVPDLTP